MKNMEAKQELKSATPDPALQDWISKQLNEAASELIKRGLVQAAVAEAKPAWVLPFTLLIGRIRDLGREDGFDWFICGDGPLTHVRSDFADSPREAARHFALQWQLLASRMNAAQGDELAKKAGALYELVEEDQLWLSRKAE
jgi:hypothetical protein